MTEQLVKNEQNKVTWLVPDSMQNYLQGG